MAQEAQPQRYHYTANDGRAAGTEHGRETYNGVGNYIVQQNNSNCHAHACGVLYIIHAENQLQKAVNKGSKGAPFNPPAVADKYQRYHAADGQPAAESP